VSSTIYFIAEALYLAGQTKLLFRNIGKGKATPLQALTGPEGSRSLRLPDFKIIGI
jgi:hypothetical protein